MGMAMLIADRGKWSVRGVYTAQLLEEGDTVSSSSNSELESEGSVWWLMAGILPSELLLICVVRVVGGRGEMMLDVLVQLDDQEGKDSRGVYGNT